MHERLKKLLEERATLWTRMQTLLDSDDAEARSNYDAADTEMDRLNGEIERLQRHIARGADLDHIDRSGVVDTRGDGAEGEDGPDVAYRSAFGQFLRRGASDMDLEQRQVLQRGLVAPGELRALGVGTGAAGGFTVDPEFRARMVETMRAFGGMMEVAEVITTDTGANLQWPTNDDTANVGAILAENTQVTEQDVTLGTNSLDAYAYTSKLVRVSYQLLQDSVFDLETWLARKMGERLGRIHNQHFTTGTGTAQPDGLVTGAPVGKVGAAGQVTTVTYDDLIDLIDSVDPSYQGNGRFMLSQQSRKAIRKLKDTQGRPLWEPSVQAGTPDTLLGYGIALNQDLPAPAASAKSILFGDYREAYLIRMVRDVTLLRLNERYADFLQVGFLAFDRADGTLQNSAAVRAYQHPAA